MAFLLNCHAKEVEILVQKNTIKLVEITNYDNSLVFSHFDINTPEKKTITTSLQDYFQTEFLVFNASESATVYTLLIPENSDYRVITDLPKEKLVEFEAYQSRLKRLVSTPTPDEIASLHQFLTLPEGTYLPYSLEQNLVHNLAYFYLKESRFTELVELLKNQKINADQRILLHCSILKNFIPEQKTSSIDRSLLITEFAYSLFLKYTMDGDVLPTEKGLHMDHSTFIGACGISIERLKKMGMPSISEIEDPNISILELTKTLLDFALVQSSKNKNSLTTTDVLSRIWYYYQTIDGGNESAEKVASQAIKIIETHPDEVDRLSQLLIMHYSILHRQGKYADIRKSLSKLLGMLDNLSPYYKKLALFTAGHFYRKIGEFDLAQRFFLNSIKTFKKQDFKDQSFSCFKEYKRNLFVGKVLTNISYISQQNSDSELALKQAQCAINMLENTQDRYLLTAMLEKARALKSLNKDEEAKIIAMRLLEMVPYPAVAIDALILIFDIELSQNKIVESERTAKKLATLLRLTSFLNSPQPTELDGDYPLRKVAAYSLMIKKCAMEKNYECMRGFFKAAERLIKNPQTKLVNPQAWNAARYTLVEQMVDNTLRSEAEGGSNAATIFTLLERNYSVELEHDLRFYQQTPEETLINKHKHFESWMATERALLTAKDADKKELRYQADLAKTLYFEEQIPSNPDHSNNVLSVNEIQSRIPADHFISRYFIGNHHSFAIDLTNSSVKVRNLPSKKEITHFVEGAMPAPDNMDWSKINNTRFLKELLPLEQINSGKYKKLMIIPDHMLHRIPFAAINIAAKGNPYIRLSSKVAIFRISSASDYFSEMESKRSHAEKSLALFSLEHSAIYSQQSNLMAKRGLQSAFAKLPALPGTKEEVEFISRLLIGFRNIDGIGANATSDFLMSKEVRNSNILHIATHGIVDPDYPDVIALMSSDIPNQKNSGYITLSQLMSKESNNDLVVISGCDTMIGKLYTGSGMQSLTRGFLAQGAGAVIGTLWSVPDRATAKFMKLFYLNLQANSGDIALALNQTKVAFSQSARYKNPKYWAGFAFTSSNHAFHKIAL